VDYSHSVAKVNRHPMLKKSIEDFLERKKEKGLELSDENREKFYALMLQQIPGHILGQVTGKGNVFRAVANGIFFHLGAES